MSAAAETTGDGRRPCRWRSAGAPTTSSSGAACSPRPARRIAALGARAARRRHRRAPSRPLICRALACGLDGRRHCGHAPIAVPPARPRRCYRELVARLRRGRSPRGSSAAISSSRSAAASSATSPASPPRSCGAACASCRCRPRSWRRSIPPSAARPASTPPRQEPGRRLPPAEPRARRHGVLDTLPAREMRAGYAEVVKYGLIDDAAFFAWCEANWRGVFAGGARARRAVARRLPRQGRAWSLRDEREEGDRALLNLGHTFAHALERLTRLRRRRASCMARRVAIGLACAFRFSARLGPVPGAGRRRGSRRHLRAVGLPTRHLRRPGRARLRRRAPRRHGPGQEGQARRADLHPGARHRPELHRPRRRRREVSRPFLDESKLV